MGFIDRILRWFRNFINSIIDDDLSSEDVNVPTETPIIGEEAVNYKVGDRVRFKNTGKVGEIVALDDVYNGYTIKFDDEEEPMGVFYDDDLEKVDSSSS